MKAHIFKVFICVMVYIASLIVPSRSYSDTTGVSSNTLSSPTLGRKESVLGGFDFSAELMTDNQLIRLYGKGCRDSKQDFSYHRIYYFPEVDNFAAFEVETDSLVTGLKLTKENIASKKCLAKKTLKYFQTGKGLKLGDNTKKVIALYGKPSYKSKLAAHKIEFVYLNINTDTPVMEIVLKRDKVISIYLTNGD